MTQENKELVLKDLCARVYYDVICQIYDPQRDYGEDIFDARLIHIDAWTSHCNFWGCSETDPYKIEQVKPYLRPMSSMTEEERHEIQEILGKDTEIFDDFINIIDSSRKRFSFFELIAVFEWLNAHYFDYRGLIEKGLALEAPEEMYK